jgi:hypothetical protein
VTEGQGARVFDMPHARVTLTPVGPNVEIEVWPKAGQSAYVVVDPTVAVLIARQLVELAAAQFAAAQVAADPDADGSNEGDPDEGAAPAEPGRSEPAPAEAGSADSVPAEPGPANVVDLASRRRKGGPASKS